MRIEPEISGVGVVLLGDFNPAIFTPAWFALHGLLPESTADNANLQIAHSQVLVFSTEWLNLQVTTDRFAANTQREPHIRVRDLVVRVFKEHLYHTPLRAIGINREVHFRVAGPVEQDRIGRMLAPVEPWGSWREELELDGDHGGMTSLTMAQLRPAGRPPGGQVNVTVEPSVRIDGGRSGIRVSVNDHYAVGSADTEGRTQLMGFLEDGFDSSIRRSDGVIDHIMSLATGREVRAS